MIMALSQDAQPRLCQPPGVCLACFGPGMVATVPAFHDALQSCRDVPVTVHLPRSDLQSLFIPILHISDTLRSCSISPKLGGFQCSPIYLHINAPIVAFNIGAHCLYIYAFFGYRTCLTSTFFIVPFLDSHHYHKVLQHIEASC